MINTQQSTIDMLRLKMTAPIFPSSSWIIVLPTLSSCRIVCAYIYLCIFTVIVFWTELISYHEYLWVIDPVIFSRIGIIPNCPLSRLMRLAKPSQLSYRSIWKALGTTILIILLSNFVAGYISKVQRFITIYNIHNIARLWCRISMGNGGGIWSQVDGRATDTNYHIYITIKQARDYYNKTWSQTIINLTIYKIYVRKIIPVLHGKRANISWD